ncbi:MAG: hypothetical protein KME50_23500 [Nostoc desertorum CM1-VF14]|jgi:hypothetical protein|nr:hypothetical protein [Nostoc desertorum CM1-VF14]
MSLALWNGLPPQVGCVDYSDLLVILAEQRSKLRTRATTGEGTAFGSWESCTLHVTYLKVGVRASSVCPAPTLGKRRLPTS